MTRWDDPDVTPVVRRPGAPSPLTSSVSRHDPFGAGRGPGRRSWTLAVVGALMVVAGMAWSGLSIVSTAKESGSMDAGQVAEGVVTEDRPAQLSFRATSQDYTVYVRTEGVRESEQNNRDATVSSISCTARLPDGASHDFTGSRQGSSVVIGDAASVGWFTASPGVVDLTCGYTDRSRFSEQRRDDGAQLFVAPGKPAGSSGVLGIVGGAFLAVGGGLVLGRGLVGR